MLQSESPAIRMARKYQDNHKKNTIDESQVVPDENSEGDLIAVNDEMRISDEHLQINT